MRKLLAIVLLSLSLKSSLAQQTRPQNKQDVIGVCAKFMVTFGRQKFSEAFDMLKPYSVIEKYKLDTMANTVKSQMVSLSSSYGKIISYEELSEKDIRSSLIQLLYLLKFEKAFLKFTFILYNNGSSWTITNFRYSDQIDDLFTTIPKQP
jgi:hypothetical protein